jgi:hypothetical protein
MSAQAPTAFEGWQQPSCLWQLDGPPGPGVLVDRLVSDLALGRIESVAFVVPSHVSWTLPLYDVAIATARRGWELGIEDVRYWFVTPEPEPLASLGTAAIVAASQSLEPEGITFIGSTYPDIRHGLVLLDPQGESIEVDLVVSLGHSGGFDVTSDRRRFGRRCRAYRSDPGDALSAVLTVHSLRWLRPASLPESCPVLAETEPLATTLVQPQS